MIKIDHSKKMDEIVECKGFMIKYGRSLFNMCLPEKYPVVDEEINDKKLSSILDDIAMNYPPDDIMRTLDMIKDLGFKMSTKFGYTLSIDDLYNPKFEKIANSLNENEHDKNMEKIAKNEFLNELKNKPFYDFVKSGARGNADQLRQMLVCRGYVADAFNRVILKLIRSSYLKGLNESEFFDSSWGTRKGLIDTAHSTSAGGFITRQMIYSTTSVVLGTERDCGTDEFLSIKPKVLDSEGNVDEPRTKALLKSILWRYALVDGKLVLITDSNIEDFKNMKIIKMRSPIYCKTKGVCHTCYGNLHKILHSDQIGIIASQSISERITQLILRTFHHSGAAAKSGKDDGKNKSKNEDIVHDMAIVNKILHSPEKYKKFVTPFRLVWDLNRIFCLHGRVNLVHYEVLVSAMMRDRAGKPWRISQERGEVEPQFHSIMKIPSMDSWLLGVAFTRLKAKLLDGLVTGGSDVPSSIGNIFKL